jgi:hypothetical protein
MVVCTAAAVLVLCITPALTMVVLAEKVLCALFIPARLARTPQLAQAHHESLY